MKIRIVEKPLVEAERSRFFEVGTVHEVVREVFSDYSPTAWPNARAANVAGGRVRSVFVHKFDMVLLPHEYEEYNPKPLPAAATDKPELRKSVTERLQDAIMDFFRRGKPGEEFKAEHLRSFVEENSGVLAPESAGRVMRDLRKAGKINYECVSQSKGIYVYGARP